MAKTRAEPGGTPPRGRIDKREAILDAAFRVFAEQGYDQAGVEAIAAEAGVAKATIYNHFGDKESLLRAIISDLAEGALAEHLAIVERLTDDRDLRAALEDVGYGLLDRYFDEKTVWFRRLLAAEITQFPDLLDIVRGRTADRIMDALANRLARLALAGRLRITDPVVAADQFWALLAGPAEVRSMMGTRRITETELRTVVSQGVDTFLRAFGPPGETA
ncbi:MAG TPA: TetR/AcrR family transcriptional regulator [Nocardioidaceae bacterium]|nr:TetR/AcrR family transcriptional regulator [Nocardioidaceae bacterium]